MKQIHILLAEDNEGDILLTRETIEAAKIEVQLSVVKDGKEAIDFMNRQGVYTDINMPDLLLLDINMPKKNGHEVLKYLKQNKDLKHIPVIILSTSSSNNDIKSSLDNHASLFMTKPFEISDLMRGVALVEHFRNSSNNNATSC